MNLIKHFLTISKHKSLVLKHCFKIGLYKQGILHDMSKYSPTEFIPGVKYYQGYRSPIDKEKEVKGYSLAWLHHKALNKHHWEYWYDTTKMGFVPLEMPFNYICEMICDRIAACKTYLKDSYTDSSAYNYFMKNIKLTPMHPKTLETTKRLLSYIKDYGENKGFDLIKKELKAYKKEA